MAPPPALERNHADVRNHHRCCQSPHRCYAQLNGCSFKLDWFNANGFTVRLKLEIALPSLHMPDVSVTEIIEQIKFFRTSGRRWLSSSGNDDHGSLNRLRLRLMQSWSVCRLDTARRSHIRVISEHRFTATRRFGAAWKLSAQ